MARVIVYNGHSSVVPILDASHNGFIPIIKIKEEPVDDNKNYDEYMSSTKRNTPNNSLSKQSASKQVGGKNIEELKLTPRRLTRRSAAAIEASKRIQGDGENAKGTDYDGNNSKQLSKEVSTPKASKNVSKSVSNTRKSTSQRSWECEICHASFSDPYYLKKHVGYYTPNSLRCRKCNKIFGSIYDLMHHRTSVHRKGDYLTGNRAQCDFCKQILISKQNLQQHIYHYHKDEIGAISELPNNKNQTSEKVVSPTSRLNTSNLSIRQHKAAKRKRTQSCSYVENRSIIPEHSINTRLNSERKSLFGIQANSHENVTLLLNKSQLSNSNSPKKSISSTKSPGNSSHPPLVQIYAIPNEVEALLSDFEDIPTKRMKLQVLSNKNSDNGTKIDYNLNRSSAPTTLKLDDSSRTLTRTILTLKENFNCLDCSVKLEKLKTSSDSSKSKLDKLLNISKSPEKLLEKSREKSSEKLLDKPLEKPLEKSSSVKESLPDIELTQISSAPPDSENSTLAVCGTIGIELENLDIALKILKNPKKISNARLSSNLSSSLEGINVEHSYSATPSEVSEEKEKTEKNNENKQPGKIKSIYLSSICRTRFTTQKKLIYHYLNYHSYPNYICAVCRTECSRLGELKKHLAVHCISIPKSLDDRSPIDLKGPCENSKKKFICKGCKTSFSSFTCLEEHTGQCKILEAKREKKRHSNIHEVLIVNDQNTSDNSMINQNKETLTLLQPSSSEITLKELENNPIEINDPPSPSLPVLPSSIPTNIDTHENPINLIEKTLQNMEKWSQYTHSAAPRQRNPSNAYFQHQCKICYSRFQCEENLNDHLKKFEPKNMSRCEKCGTHFPSIGLLSAHKKAAHSTDSMIYRMYCLICDQGFSKKKNLRHHTMHIHCAELQAYNKSPELDTEYEMTCRICHVSFKTRKQFIEHSMYYYNDRTITCDVCSEEFYGQYKAHAHIQQVHFKEFYTSYTHLCKICQDRFKYESHLRSHIFHIHKDRIVNAQCKNQHPRRQCFVCSVCTECFYTPKLLKEHKMEFSNTGVYQCNYCDRKCETLRLIEEHKKRCHYDSVPHLKKCNLCSEFVSKRFWLIHFKHFHENEPPLELYMRNYSESRRYQQEPNVLNTYDNDRNLSNFSAWIPSEQFLENVIEYTCAICDMKFKSDNELKEHRKIHRYDNLDVSTVQQRNESENHELIPFTFVNQDSLEPEPSVVTYESDEDTKYNFSIANICSVELKEYDSLYNPDTTNKEINPIGDNFNHCDACHYTRKIEYSDHTYQKVKRHEATCNEALTTRNVKQTSLPNVHREFSASNQPELIVKSKETAEVPQKISTSSAQSSLVSDPQSQQKKPSGTCKIQTTINQYFQKSPIEKNISALCDICGLAFEKSLELIRHKNNDHRDDGSSQTHLLTKTQSSSTSRNTDPSFSLSFKDPLINQKSPPQKYIITIRDNNDTPVINNRTDILTKSQCNDNLQKSSSLSDPSMDNNQFQRITIVDKGILYSYLQKPVN